MTRNETKLTKAGISSGVTYRSTTEVEVRVEGEDYADTTDRSLALARRVAEVLGWGHIIVNGNQSCTIRKVAPAWADGLDAMDPASRHNY